MRRTQTHREFPITLKTNRGPILEGVIDLAFLEGDKWCVVDFKTDTDIESKLHEYSDAGRLVRRTQ